MRVKQRFIHYYFLNEIIHLSFLLYLYITSTPILHIFFIYLVFYLSNFIAYVVSVSIDIRLVSIKQTKQTHHGADDKKRV